ncbi:MAG: von Willebrand factor type A domain-containing protein [Caldilineaceae bacterium]
MFTSNFKQQLISFSLLAAIVSGCASGYAPAPASSEGGSAGGEATYSYAAPAAQSVVAEAAPTAMYFADYGVNGVVATSQDHLSTFGMDVDTGTYTLMRSYLNDGNLPPADAVRVEELVNYFDYHYPYPDAAATFGITMDAAPTPFGPSPMGEGRNTTLLRIGLQGYDIPADARKDVALTFVIDVSGSMDMENRLGLAKRALNLLVEELRPTDTVAIVVYGSRARTVLPMTSAAEKNTIIDAIGRLAPDGSTNAEAGLRMGYELAWRAYNPNAINRVVLISDGVANVGQTGPDAILATIAQYAAQGITMTSVGVGMGNYNDVLMEQLADQGDGFYAYVDDIAAARKLFVDDLTSTLQTIAKDAKIQVDFNPETVASYRLVGYENRDVADDDFRNDEVDGGEVGAGHSVTALYEVVLQPAVQDTQAPLATVYVRWQDLTTGEVMESNRTLTYGAITPTFDAAAPSFQLAATVAQYGEILRNSEWAGTTTLDEVLATAQQVETQLSATQGPDAAVTEFIDLVWRATQLRDAQANAQ